MTLLRCSKCGSDAGFLIETKDGRLLESRRPLPTDRIKSTVRVTCTYCNSKWDHVPVMIRDASEDAVARPGMSRQELRH